MSAKQLAALGLCAISFGIFGVLALGGVFIPLGFAFGIVPLVSAALLLVGWRWISVLAVVLGGLFLFGALRASPTSARLTNPGDVLPFAATLLQLAGAVLATVAGLVATFRASAAARSTH